MNREDIIRMKRQLQFTLNVEIVQLHEVKELMKNRIQALTASLLRIAARAYLMDPRSPDFQRDERAILNLIETIKQTLVVDITQYSELLRGSAERIYRMTQHLNALNNLWWVIFFLIFLPYLRFPCEI